MSAFVLQPSRVLTPDGFRDGYCVVMDGGVIRETLPSRECPGGLPRSELEGDLVPGFIDLQVNGGGGVLFNDQPTIEGIAAIEEAHRRGGTTGFLPTLISDDLAVVARAIAAVD